MATTLQLSAIAQHGENLLAIFPQSTERDPVKLCKKLRRLEARGAALGLRLCNGPEFAEGEDDKESEAILVAVNKLLGNVNEYQPKTGAKCGCRRGVQRDNCPSCEGTGYAVDFAAIRNRKPLVPVILNRDPRGYALKIDDEWMQTKHSATGLRHPHNAASYDIDVAKSQLHRDMGGYGILAPEIGKDGR